jgi:hypothetical protein
MPSVACDLEWIHWGRGHELRINRSVSLFWRGMYGLASESSSKSSKNVQMSHAGAPFAKCEVSLKILVTGHL